MLAGCRLEHDLPHFEIARHTLSRSRVNPFKHKMAKHTLKILRCEHRKIFRVRLSILQHYA